jgi:hypothetical protein
LLIDYKALSRQTRCNIVMAGLDPANFASTVPREMAGSVAGDDTKVGVAASMGLRHLGRLQGSALTVSGNPVLLR